MTVFVTKSDDDDEISLMIRAEGPGVIGDVFEHVLPGETVLGKTYEEWAAALADGVAEIDEI